MRWKRAIVLISILTIAGVGYRLYSQNLGPRFQQDLRKLEADMKLELPKRIDETTTLIDVRLEPTKTTYWYTLDDAIDPQAMEREVRATVCANPEFARTIREKAFTYEYHYSDAKGAPVALFTVSACSRGQPRN
jgi:hypothetical protein